MNRAGQGGVKKEQDRKDEREFYPDQKLVMEVQEKQEQGQEQDQLHGLELADGCIVS